MEQRFKFLAPSPRELFLGLWGKPLTAFVLAMCIVLNPFAALPFPVKVVIGLIALAVVAGLVWRIADIGRRDEQARYGSVELTGRELRISLSPHSLLRVSWPDFVGSEQKNGWLYFRFHDATIEQGDTSKRLDRIRFGELETPDALINALRIQTPPHK